MRQHSGGGGVADPHLAEADHIAVLIVLLPHAGSPGLECLPTLLDRHRRLVEEVPRPIPHLPRLHAILLREVPIHAGIDDAEVEVVLPTEDGDRRISSLEGAATLVGKVLRREAHPLIRYPVIATEEEECRSSQLRRKGVLDQADLTSYRLELSERTDDLRSRVDLVLYFFYCYHILL